MVHWEYMDVPVEHMNDGQRTERSSRLLTFREGSYHVGYMTKGGSMGRMEDFQPSSLLPDSLQLVMIDSLVCRRMRRTH